MRESVYISKHLESLRMDLIIEEDKHSIWTYLLDSENENKIVLDGFVCSTGTVVKKSSDVKEFIDIGFAPPISEDFINDFSIQKGLQGKDFKIKVSDNVVIIAVKGTDFVILDLLDSKSYTKAVSMSGPYGLPIEKMED